MIESRPMRFGLPHGRLAVCLVLGVAALAYAAGDSQSYQRPRVLPDAYSIDYGYLNFNQDRIDLSYKVPKRALASYEAEFGYRMQDAKAAPDPAAYLQSRGFRFIGDHLVFVDVPGTVRRNAPLFKPISLALDKIAQDRGYDQGDLLGAVVSLTQTAMLYKELPDTIGDLHIGGFMPPMAAFVKGWGNCDTKTAVAASILSNWPHMRMVGVAVPGHYLFAVLRIPNKDDMFVEYDGLQYVLVEPVGPAWLPPGTVAQSTQDLLASSEGYRIEPFF